MEPLFLPVLHSFENNNIFYRELWQTPVPPAPHTLGATGQKETSTRAA